GNFGVRRKTEQTALTISLGVATVREGDTVETIFHRADEALYQSKRGGRNQVCFAPETPAELAPQPETHQESQPAAPLSTATPLQLSIDGVADSFTVETGAGA